MYRLDKGGNFRMSRVRNRLMAQLGERPVTELVAESATHLVAPEQNMTVDYVPLAFGDQVILRYPADLARADAPMVTVQLAAD